MSQWTIAYCVVCAEASVCTTKLHLARVCLVPCCLRGGSNNAPRNGEKNHLRARVVSGAGGRLGGQLVPTSCTPALPHAYSHAPRLSRGHAAALRTQLLLRIPV
jgi:hypothetical protein